MAVLLTACPPPNGGGKPADITPTIYTTTVSGKVTTPAGKAVTQYRFDGAAGPAGRWRDVPSADDAEVRASTEPAAKAVVAADGSFTLSVTHPGTFTLSVDYPAGRDYKAGAPQTVTTTATAHTRNIALSYGYTTTLDGRVTDTLPSGVIIARNGATVTVSVEGREVGRTLSRTIEGRVGDYSITFEHPGAFRAAASFSGRNDVHSRSNYRGVLIDRHNFILSP